MKHEDMETGLPFDLWTACSVGELECVRHLLTDSDPTASLNDLNLGGWSGLMYASYYDHPKLVAFLISSGCNPSVSNKGREKTALMMAASCGHIDVINVLTRIAPDPQTILLDKDSRGFDALFHATTSGHVEACQALLMAKSNPNSTEHSRGLTPLLLAAEEGHERVVELLLKYGADPGYKTITGESATSLALRRGHDRIANLIEINKSPRLPTLRTSAAVCPGVWDGPQRAALLLEQQRSVSNVLTKLDLAKYQEHFSDMSFEEFLQLGDDDLKQRGITLLGPRRKITAAVEKLKKKPSNVAHLQSSSKLPSPRP